MCVSDVALSGSRGLFLCISNYKLKGGIVDWKQFASDGRSRRADTTGDPRGCRGGQELHSQEISSGNFLRQIQVDRGGPLLQRIRSRLGHLESEFIAVTCVNLRRVLHLLQTYLLRSYSFIFPRSQFTYFCNWFLYFRDADLFFFFQ